MDDRLATHTPDRSTKAAGHSRASRSFILDSGAGGAIHRWAHGLAALPPWAAFAVVLLAGYVALLTVTLAAGFLVTDALMAVDAVGDADRYLPDVLAENRTDDLTDVSWALSLAGDVPILPALVAVACIAAAVARRWAVVAFLLTASVLELTIYHITAVVVSRNRPDVERLDQLPVDHSFPSGHVAATVMVYAGIALLVASLSGRRWLAVTCWSIAVLAVIAVALSRVYRGMHHPLDTIGGVLLGAGALLVGVIAVRVYAGVRRARSSPEIINPAHETRPA